ncbi:MAG: type II toxin-antitoxin system RelE/ParE family toxin [Lachnospiraceae bacterium]|nr:type II toxin-antitoxin system RelE/ParE family toxin [Lachnospiraceae bacterium]
MYEVHFYRNRKGEQPALSYLKELLGKKDKDSRIRAGKIHDYINLLREYGTFIGEPAVKHIEGDIWELRPARDRVLFVAWHNNGYVLLHAFEKHTQKTPEREKKRAREEYKDLKERGLNDE